MDAASAIQDVGHHPLSEMSATTIVRSNAIGREEGNGNRFLRIREAEGDDEEEDLDAEERGGLSKILTIDDLNAKFARVSKMDEKAGLAKLENMYAKHHAQMTSSLQALKDKGWNIKSLGKEIGIGNKLKTMTPAQLRNDADYVLWVQFAAFLKNRPLPAPV
ncbi:hypothetical protein PHYBOEH_002447 [Phytophthora boehmeriae]|uniref:RxLR effector protein n=1 Tax=Phytophthora boehmeriae TaxID=109152 RepID=A0A8T1WUK3_9STRA|nr:hypothetical protein PHYBOEH_002447 [Phytophthora boehmeriae]